MLCITIQVVSYVCTILLNTTPTCTFMRNTRTRLVSRILALTCNNENAISVPYACTDMRKRERHRSPVHLHIGAEYVMCHTQLPGRTSLLLCILRFVPNQPVQDDSERRAVIACPDLARGRWGGWLTGCHVPYQSSWRGYLTVRPIRQQYNY